MNAVWRLAQVYVGGRQQSGRFHTQSSTVPAARYELGVRRPILRRTGCAGVATRPSARAYMIVNVS
jgi:hypothetical protein